MIHDSRLFRYHHGQVEKAEVFFAAARESVAGRARRRSRQPYDLVSISNAIKHTNPRAVKGDLDV
jgi:hypothetical protein